MSTPQYRATLSGEQGRSGWCVIFRHPIRKNPDGSAVRVRRGLGTKAQDEAQRLVDQLNHILGDTAYWTPQAKAKAESLYDERIVNAFYDQLLPAAHDAWSLRNQWIPLPGPRDGYSRARILGTTGAGKTTLVRQLIGTSPIERFPSTSTAKTTVSDIEIVLTSEPIFKAVVTFFSREHIRLLIEESALSAANAFTFESGKLTNPAARLLEHSEMRFRLSYVLGTSDAGKAPAADDEDEDEPELIATESGDEGEVTPEERAYNAERIRGFLARLERIAAEAVAKVERDLGVSRSTLTKSELDSFQETFEQELRSRENFHEVVDEILDAVEERFEALGDDGFGRDRNGWPLLWQCEMTDRADFIRTVNRFSSNYAPNFGKLLTPLVQGIRVAGPFRPDWMKDADLKLVLMDGEGIGHTSESSASLSTSITQRLDDADAVVLVDNAEQPMQAGPQAVLRTLASSGHESKLIVCFTHFDAVKGDNLPDSASKKQHVFRSLQNAIGSVREILGRGAENALSRTVSERVFFVSNIQNPLKDSAKMTLGEIRSLVSALQRANVPPPPSTATPVYDLANLVLCIPKAMTAFREPWRARLRLPSQANLSPEHWTRIKAMSRRFAELGKVEYLELRPIADFISRLSEQVIVFLSTPARWEPETAPEEMKRQVTNAIARQVYAHLHTLGEQRLFHQHVRDWVAAYSHRGTGSTNERARDIDRIYGAAAPIPAETGAEQTNQFVGEITRVVRAAVQDAGGRFE